MPVGDFTMLNRREFPIVPRDFGPSHLPRLEHASEDSSMKQRRSRPGDDICVLMASSHAQIRSACRLPDRAGSRRFHSVPRALGWEMRCFAIALACFGEYQWENIAG